MVRFCIKDNVSSVSSLYKKKSSKKYNEKLSLLSHFDYLIIFRQQFLFRMLTFLSDNW